MSEQEKRHVYELKNWPNEIFGFDYHRDVVICAATRIILTVANEVERTKKCPAEIEILPELIKAITPLL